MSFRNKTSLPDHWQACASLGPMPMEIYPVPAALTRALFARLGCAFAQPLVISSMCSRNMALATRNSYDIELDGPFRDPLHHSEQAPSSQLDVFDLQPAAVLKSGCQHLERPGTVFENHERRIRSRTSQNVVCFYLEGKRTRISSS